MALGGDDGGSRVAVLPDDYPASDDIAPSDPTQRRAGKRVFALLVLLLIVAGVVVLGITQRLPGQSAYSGPPVSSFPPGTLIVNFGLNRSSLTRSIVVSSGSTLSPAPSVLVARVASDLVQATGAKQFPADQITLTATPVGAQSVQIVATLSPMNPEKVGDGLFTGKIEVYTGSKTLVVPLAVYLTPKSGFRAVLAFSLLLLGAALGLSVKWITEALSDLSAAHRRFDRLRSSLGDLKNLPDDAAARLDEISDRIKSQDIGQLEESFRQLEKDRRPLRYFCMTIGQVNYRIQKQKQILEQESDSRKVAVAGQGAIIVDRERMKVRELQATKWPWEAAESEETILKKALELSRQSLIISNVLNEPGRFPEVLYKFQCDEFDEAEKEYLRTNRPEADRESAMPIQAASPKAAARSRKPRARHFTVPPRAQRRGLLRGDKTLTEWMTERPRAMVGAASVIVVSIVGLQVQYMDSTTFTGSLSDWLTLLLWAAVIELSGVSLLDVVGRLGGAKTAPRT